jgi:hypothetical protein
MRLSTDALRKRVCLFLSLALVVCASRANLAFGATFKTANFIVTAPTAEIAEKCGKTAEFYREEVALQWLGKTMPRWYKPCTLTVKVGQIGAGGATTFAFDRGEVFGWRMNVQGSLERILDSVIPHEVSHTVFACHFRRPLLAIKEYPSDMQDVLTLYAEGYSLADFLVQAGGKTRYLEFLDTAHEEGWDRAIAKHYSLKGVDELESRWNDWVMAGSPQLKIPKGSQVASNTPAAKSDSPPPEGEFERPVIRAQSPEENSPGSKEHIASAPKSNAHVNGQVHPPVVPLTKTAETQEASPGWRKIREQMQEIPADFVNPAFDPTRLASAPAIPEPLPKDYPAGTEHPEALAEAPALPKASSAISPPSNVPAFRFELDETPGGQNSELGRSPNWSGYPRTQPNRDPAALENASNGPFSP